jgi:hypothetical protein
MIRVAKILLLIPDLRQKGNVALIDFGAGDTLITVDLRRILSA